MILPLQNRATGGKVQKNGKKNVCRTHQNYKSSIDAWFEIEKRYSELLGLNKALVESLYHIEYQAKNGCK